MFPSSAARQSYFLPVRRALKEKKHYVPAKCTRTRSLVQISHVADMNNSDEISLVSDGLPRAVSEWSRLGLSFGKTTNHTARYVPSWQLGQLVAVVCSMPHSRWLATEGSLLPGHLLGCTAAPQPLAEYTQPGANHDHYSNRHVRVSRVRVMLVHQGQYLI